MKIIKNIFLFVLALILILSCGIFILFQTFDADQFLPRIIDQASLAIGRSVAIEHAGLGVSLHGITLDLGPLSVADDPAFTTQPFITIERVRVGLNPLAFILDREIRLTNVLVESPKLHFIRSAQGDLNIRGFLQNVQILSNKTKRVDDARPNLSATDHASAPLDPSPIIPRKNGHKKGPISFSKHIKSFVIKDASISYIDQSQALPLDIWLRHINIKIKDVSWTRPFAVSLDASFYSIAPNVQAKAMVSWDLSKKLIDVSDLDFKAELTQMDHGLLKGITTQMSDDSIFYNIVGNIELKISHIVSGEPKGLVTQGEIIITDGVIKNFNVIKTVLSQALGALGGMEGLIDSVLGNQFKERLNDKDTVIQKADAKISILDKTVNIQDALIKTNVFDFNAQGSLDAGSNLDLETKLYLDQGISEDLIKRMDGLKLLCDDSKRIVIGASLNGVIPHLKYKPNKDFRKKSTKVLISEGGNILGLLLSGGKTSIDLQGMPSPDGGKKSKKKFKNLFKGLFK